MSDIKITSDNGDCFDAYVAYPDTDKKVPAILVIQEIFGVNKNMRDICDQIANEGYVAICPDLFWRFGAGIQLDDRNEKDLNQAFEYYKSFNEDLGVSDLKDTLKAIRKLDKVNGKVGSLGFCLGGKLSYLMATRSDIDCSVCYYGVGIENQIDEMDNTQNPCIIHMAENDGFVPKKAQELITVKADKLEHIETFIYDGVDHAFARVDGDHYNEKSAYEANMRTSTFFANNLS